MSFHFLDFFVPVSCLIALSLSWKDVNARYMSACYLLSSVICLLTLNWALTKPIGFYAWSMLMTGIFLVFVFGRRYWAYKFENIKFFSDAYEQHRYTPQEAGLVIISLVCIISNFITLVEVYLYWIDWLDNAYYKLYIRDSLQKLAIVLTSLIYLSFGIKTLRKQELSEESL
jgi:hypothetical protein